MRNIKNFGKRSGLFLMAFGLFASWVVGDIALFTEKVSAADITSRSLAVSSSANGTLTDGQNVTYTFTFDVPGSPGTSVQSLDFEFCETPLPGLDCNLPAGQSVSSATIGGQSGLTGWSLGAGGDAPTDSWSNGTSGTGGRVRVTRSDATVIGSDTTMSIAFDGITNPSADNDTFFVRIVSYEDTSWTSTRDNGSVASSTAQQIDITARVQETLNFSVGAPDPGSVPAAGTACDPLTDDGALDLGDTDGVLSFNTAYDAYSYFRVSTNANGGTSIQYSGNTLEYNTNDIDEIGGTATNSSVGTEQFGLAIDDLEADYSFAELSETTEYNTGEGTISDGGTANFAFDTGSVTTPVPVATASQPIVCDTAAVRYIGNVATTTPPGIYTTTITYIAVPTY